MGVNSTHAGSLYCLNGDLSSQGLPSLATWPIQAFARTPTINIATMEEMVDLLEAAPGLDFLPPYADGDENTETGQCRLLCPLPAKYAALALRRPVYSPSDFWHLIIQQVIEDGNAMSCRELLLWARMTFHQWTLADGTLAVVNVSGALTAPVSDAEMLDQDSGWLQADLPDRTPQASAVAVQQQLIAQQQMLKMLVANQQLAAATINQPHRKTVAEVYPTFLIMLLKYCRVANEAALPPIYEQMANSKKSEQVVLTQYSLASRADEVGWAPPIASPELVTAIFSMSFTSPDVDNLTGAINKFHINPSNDGQASGIRKRQNVYSIVYAGSVAPTIEQLQHLVNTAPQMARDLVSLLTTFRAYSVVLDVIFGEHQVLAVAFRNLVRRWELEAQSVVHAVFSVDEMPALMPLFQRRVQLENQYWMNQVPFMPPGSFPTVPDYGNIIRDVQMRNWNNFQTIHARHMQRTPAPQPSLPALNAGGSPVNHVPPPVTAPPPAPPPRQPAASNAVNNPTPNTTLMARYGRYGGRLRP
jgi:hypothetical protein